MLLSELLHAKHREEIEERCHIRQSGVYLQSQHWGDEGGRRINSSGLSSYRGSSRTTWATKDPVTENQKVKMEGESTSRKIWRK